MYSKNLKNVLKHVFVIHSVDINDNLQTTGILSIPWNRTPPYYSNPPNRTTRCCHVFPPSLRNLMYSSVPRNDVTKCFPWVHNYPVTVSPVLHLINLIRSCLFESHDDCEKWKEGKWGDTRFIAPVTQWPCLAKNLLANAGNDFWWLQKSPGELKSYKMIKKWWKLIRFRNSALFFPRNHEFSVSTLLLHLLIFPIFQSFYHSYSCNPTNNTFPSSFPVSHCPPVCSFAPNPSFQSIPFRFL